MLLKCPTCSSKNASSALYCSKCGSKLPLPQVQTKTENKKYKPKTIGRVIAIILVVLQISFIVFPVLITMITEGANFGRYDFDDIVFDFLKTLGNRLTAYQRTVKHIRRYVFFAQILLIPSFLLLFIRAKSRFNDLIREKLPMFIVASVFTKLGLIASLYLLSLYSYNGLTRTITFIVFFFSAILSLASDILISIKLGANAILISIIGLLLAALITSIYVPLIGICVVTFGDLALVLGVCLLMCGSGGGSGSTVYVVII